MTDTTTTTYGLTKPGVGASENSWGTKVNDNFDDIDDLLDGTVAIKPNLTAGEWKVGGTIILPTAAEINFLDGVTSAIQTQLDGKTARTSPTGSAALPVGTTAERDATPLTGYFRFNSTLGAFEGYNGSAWGSVGGATGGGSDRVFYENGQTVTTNYTISASRNAMSAGPVTVNAGVTVTVGAGQRWIIV
ncbi:MAG: uncultured phage MedDCM-OCT-S45-C4 [Pseudomonadota bacterium]|jgi:hypothetical protein